MSFSNKARKKFQQLKLEVYNTKTLQKFTVKPHLGLQPAEKQVYISPVFEKKLKYLSLFIWMLMDIGHCQKYPFLLDS